MAGVALTDVMPAFLAKSATLSYPTSSASFTVAMSLNNATVKLAEEVGYDKVADLAKNAGITSVKATPAMALGAYDASPVDMTAAYTAFANGGVRLSPILVNSVRNAQGDVVMNFGTE